MARFKLPLSAFIFLVIAHSGGTLWAQTSQELADLLRESVRAKQNLHLKWRVDRTWYGDPEQGAAALKQIEDEIKKVDRRNTDSTRALFELNGMKAAVIDAFKPEGHDTMELTLDRFTSEKWLASVFYLHWSNRALTTSYYAMPSGLLVEYKRGSRLVNVSQTADRTQNTLIKGEPNLYAQWIVENCTEPTISSHNSTQTILRFNQPEKGNTQAFLTIDNKSLNILAVEERWEGAKYYELAQQGKAYVYTHFDGANGKTLEKEVWHLEETAPISRPEKAAVHFEFTDGYLVNVSTSANSFKNVQSWKLARISPVDLLKPIQLPKD